jgi:3-hydroxyisobutyrate dehydrogenase-like beta-hydroxyacid dehydrogenase
MRAKSSARETKETPVNRLFHDQPRPSRPTGPPGGGGPVAFIGAGQMGAPMVRRLLAAGLDVSLYARRAEVRDEFAALGARSSAALADAVSGAPVIICCLFNEPQVEEVVLGPEGLVSLAAPGTVLVSHTTIGPRLLAEIEQAAAARGLLLLDAPVSGGADDIAAGQLTILAGGDDAAVERARPALDAYGHVVPTGGIGTATRVKLVNNLLFTVHAQTAAAAALLGQQLGIETGALFAGVLACSGASRAMQAMHATGSPQEFTRRTGKYLRKDVAAALAAAAEAGTDPSLLARIAREGPLPLTGDRER